MSATPIDEAREAMAAIAHLDELAEKAFARYDHHRVDCAVCSRRLTTIGGAPVLCKIGESWRDGWGLAERKAIRALQEAAGA